jgi:hypothetical protein
MSSPRAIHFRQRGSILLVAIIFLVFFTLIAISIFKGSLTSVQAIGNMQWRNEAIAAANETIDALLSSKDAEFTAPTFDSNKTFSYDANGDGIKDIYLSFPEVKLSPTDTAKKGPRCMRMQPIPSKDLSPKNQEDINCMGGESGSYGLGITVDGSTDIIAPGISLCSNTEWQITLYAEDKVTNTSVDVTQGVGVRVLTSDAKCD